MVVSPSHYSSFLRVCAWNQRKVAAASEVFQTDLDRVIQRPLVSLSLGFGRPQHWQLLSGAIEGSLARPLQGELIAVAALAQYSQAHRVAQCVAFEAALALNGALND